MDADEARKFIRGYANAPASTVGAIAVTQLDTGKVEMEVDQANIFFTAIPDDKIDYLIKEECWSYMPIIIKRVKCYIKNLHIHKN